MGNKIRFAYDVGTNSLGWAALSIKENGQLISILGSGVRIYSDGRNPKDGKSLAEMRRVPRSARRRRDRFLQRQRKLLKVLLAHGLFPHDKKVGKDLAKLDPLALRISALDDELNPFQIGRIFWHLNQRRGFKSNRKTDGGDSDSGKIKDATKRLAEAIEQMGVRTIGEFLANRKYVSARFRQSDDPKLRFDFYPTRDMVEQEFELIWDKQKQFHPSILTDAAHDATKQAIFYQRSLKKQPVGKCTLNPNEERSRLGLPSVEARRIYEKLNSIRYGQGFDIKTPLPKIFRDAFATVLLSGKDFTLKKMKSEMKLHSEIVFNLEASEEAIAGCSTSKKLAHKDYFGNLWPLFTFKQKDEITTKFYEVEEAEDIEHWLVTEHNFSEEAAQKISGWTPKDGHASLGATANNQILSELKNDVIVYSEACERAGYQHSDFRDGEIWPRLPYYGNVLERHIIESPDILKERAKSFKGVGRKEAETGRIPNPTVHIGLNQIRRVTNKLIEAYGHPNEIVLELARDLKQSKKEKDEAQKRNAANRKKNDEHRIELEKIGIPVNGDSMLRMRLWEDQLVDGVVLCPYSLKTISFGQLFTSEIDIDHILPVSRTLDDSAANKIICFANTNRRKRNRSPFEAFGNDDNWPQIEANALSLPRNKKWRFGADAMNPKDGSDFLSRQLNETRHLAKVAKAYLGALTGGRDVWVVTGQLTSLLRGKWGLNGILSDDNQKNRHDHRHHAIDAVVIGCTTRSMVQQVAKCASKSEDMNLEKVFAEFPEPMPNFRDAVRESVNKIIVSHKVEHSKSGALHEDTAYGINVKEHELEIGNVVRRVNLDSIKPDQVGKIRDPKLREIFSEIATDFVIGGNDKKAKYDEKGFTAAILKWAKQDGEEKSAIALERGHPPRQPIRHIRMLKQEGTLEYIYNRETGKPYKAVVPAENWCVDIVSVPDRKKGGYVWKGFGAHIFEVNKKDWRPVWEREKIGGKLIMRLHKGDLIELLDDDGVRRIKRVVQLKVKNQELMLANHNESGKLQERHDTENNIDPFRWDRPVISHLKKREARKVSINEIGQLKPTKS